MKTNFRTLVGLCLPVSSLLFGIAIALGQQVPDRSFEASVSDPAFKSNHPKVLFDEAHYNVHTTKGGYKAFVDLITSDGFRVTPNGEPFTKDSLDKHDILIVVNARGAADRRNPAVNSPAFTQSECDSVYQWVAAGGAFLFISDHAPIGEACEILAQRFGVEMSKGRTCDPDHGVPNRPSISSLAFSRENGLLGDHPITQGRSDSERIRNFFTFTGQSLKGPAGSSPFLILGDSAYDEVPPDRKVVPAAGRAQGLSLVVEKGRVVVLGEAACLSAQATGQNRIPMGMNARGSDNRQMALNIMHWLAGLLE